MKRLSRSSAVALLALHVACSSPPEMIPRRVPDAPATPPPPFPDPPEKPCASEGEDATREKACCVGLIAAPVFHGAIARFDDCVPVSPARSLCVRCGDRHCGVGENTCSCPADCRP